MNDLFMPKAQRDLDELIDAGSSIKRSDSALIISSNDCLYALDSFKDRPIKIGEYDCPVNCGCEYRGELYLGSEDGVFKNSDRKIEVITYCSGMAVYDGELYYSNSLNKILGLNHGLQVAHREGEIDDLCVFDGNLYDCGVEGVYSTFEDHCVGNSVGVVRSVCGFNDHLYAVDARDGYYDVKTKTRFLDYISISDLCVFDDLMLCAFGACVVDNFGDKRLDFWQDIRSIFTVPKGCLGGLL